MELNIFKNIQHSYEYRHEPEEMRILADAYWRALLMFGALLTACFIAYGLWQLAAVIGASSNLQNSGTNALPLHKEQLQTVLLNLGARHADAQSLMTRPVTLPDPAVAR